jgi:segregation and condensation protein B
MPALETMAIIAYRQPLTKVEVEEIRGVNADGVIKTLLDRRFIKIVGKKEAPGRPLLYGTTREFLEYFGLKDLTELPTLKDLEREEAA